MENLRKLISFIRPYKAYAFFNILLNILSILFSLVSLTMIIPFLNLLFNRSELIKTNVPLGFSVESITHNFNFYLSRVIIEYGKNDALIVISLLVILLFFLRNLTRYMAMYIINPLRNGVTRDIRNKVYRHLLILPLAYFSEQRKGDIMARMANDVPEVEWSIMNTLMLLFRDPFAILLYLVTLFLISVKLSLILIISLPLSGWLISLIGKQLNSISQKGQEKLGEIVSSIEETIHGLKIIKAFNAIDVMKSRFNEQNLSYTKLMNRIYRRRDLSNPLTEFLAILVLVVIIWIGGKVVIFGGQKLSAEVFLFYLAIFSQLIPPAKNLITAYYYIERGLACFDRVEEILDAEEVIIEKKDAKPINDLKHSIEYRNVSFAYENEPVLKNINFSIKKGQKIALVGPSGGGKSTIADLLPRFYDTITGDIFVDGLPLKDYKIEDIRRLMGVVTQESILFNDSVFNNIAFGLSNASEQDVIDAAKKANAHDFIMEMPNGYQTNIGDRGIKMSGGQRQRLSIARAILRNPPVLILDEATSALDTESERIVQEALDKALEDRTSLIIAHRLSTIQRADLIVVVKNGEIVEQGTHSDLLKTNGIYRELYANQFS
jgi:subfamily B ATP-binding cassette protein MsbA